MIVLRAARSTDAGKIGAILSEFAAQTPWLPKLHTGAEDIAHAGSMIARGWVTVAEVAQRIVGFCAVDGKSLNALYVAAAARGQGVGTALMARLQEQSDRLELWTFAANARAQVFYLRHGFAEITRTDGSGNDEGLPDIKYVWTRKGSA